MAQKPVIDTSVYDKWPRIGNAEISDKGLYTDYPVSKLIGQTDGLIFQATAGNWKTEVAGGSEPILTHDERYGLFLKTGDSLGILRLGTDSVTYQAGVVSYKYASSGTGQWLGYQMSDTAKHLIVSDLVSGRQLTFSHVTDYYLSDGAGYLLLQTETIADSATVAMIDLTNGKSQVIYNGRPASFFSFDETMKQIAFIVRDSSDQGFVNSLWYFKSGMNPAKMRVNYLTAGMDRIWSVASAQVKFAKGTPAIYFQRVLIPKPAGPLGYITNPLSVDVWSYSDLQLQSVQLERLRYPWLEHTEYFAVSPEGRSAVIGLNQPGEDLVMGTLNVAAENVDSHVIVCKNNEGIDKFLTASANQPYWLVSTDDGSRRLIVRNLFMGANASMKLSPKGDYVVYFDNDKNRYFSFNVSTQTTREIGKDVSHFLFPEKHDNIIPSDQNFGLAAWMEDKKDALIYDQFDIWLVDLDGERPSINVTHSIGRERQIVLRLTKIDDYFRPLPDLKIDDTILLTAFNRLNKDNGFYSLVLGATVKPHQLTMGSYIYDLPYRSLAEQFEQWPFAPVRAKDTNLFVVRRMSAEDAPNYFSTTDFCRFNQMSHIQPQEQYNWLKAELMKWKMPDGGVGTGIMYKPENFDPKHKYPVIFYFYEKLTDGINVFNYPEWSIGILNIPTYVSNGYLVFVPDIYYTVGTPGESALNSVVSGAKYLSTLPYVDRRNLGLQGHSFGAYEVDYIISHTMIFAAACSASGVADFVSDYGGLAFGEQSLAHIYEIGQNRIGKTLWQRPDLYIKNSPLFYTDKVNTPVLLMCNKLDYAVPYSQGIEFFTGLRRLGKRAWLLQYDNQLHTVGGPAAIDFTLRMKQFFDHYLKGGPMPTWMDKGVPAIEKGYYSGF